MTVSPTLTFTTVLTDLTALTVPPKTPAEDPRVGSLDDLAVRLRDLHKITKICKDIIGLIEQRVAGEMTAKEMNLPGVAYPTRERKTSESWVDKDTSRDKMLEDGISAIVRIVAVNRETGEILDDRAKTSREVWKLVCDSFSIGADPKKAFREVLGLDPSDYRNKDTTGYKITVEEPRI